jgi:hypothetical protein
MKALRIFDQKLAHLFSALAEIWYKRKVKCKTIPLQAWTGPEGSRRLRFPDSNGNQHVKVVRLSALHTGRLYTPGNIPGTHSAAGKIPMTL